MSEKKDELELWRIDFVRGTRLPVSGGGAVMAWSRHEHGAKVSATIAPGGAVVLSGPLGRTTVPASAVACVEEVYASVARARMDASA